jgi:hypothetical protein
MPPRLPAHALRWSAVPLLVLVLAAGGCSKQGELAAADAAGAGAPTAAAPPVPGEPLVSGTRNRNGSQLAYEHEVRVRLPAARIAPSLSATRDACIAQRFGDCTLLGEELGAGEQPTGLLRMRAAPEAVAGLVGLASAQGEIAQRSTQAEDLADAVRENGMRRARLELQHRKLGEIMERRDLKPVDLFAITERMAELEAQLQVAEQEAAQQQRRIQTNLLTIHFQTTGITVASSRITEALRGVTSTWDASIGVLISVVAALLPFAVLAGLIVLLLRWARRRATPRPSSPT